MRFVARARWRLAPRCCLLLRLWRRTLGHFGGWPDKPVKIIVPFAPGGPTDIAARLIAQTMSSNLKQQFYIENQAGAGGNLGMGNAARGSARRLHHPVRFIELRGQSKPVRPRALRSLQGLQAADGRGDRGECAAGQSGRASREDLAEGTGRSHQGQSGQVHLLRRPAPARRRISPANCSSWTYKLDTVHVPFGGAGPTRSSRSSRGIRRLPSRRCQPAIPFVKDGTLRALAVANKTRVKVLPDVPTLAEGFCAFRIRRPTRSRPFWFPGRVPKDISNFIYQEVVKATKSPEVTARMDQLGLEIICNTPEEFTRQIKFEIDKWAKVIRDAGIKVQ